MSNASKKTPGPESSDHGDSPAVRVLLVDDEEGFIAVLAKRLGKRGMDVRTAPSGGDAIRILRRHDFDVALLDLKLEDMDGIEILKVFKQMAPDMPVIMLTGHGCEIAAREGLRCGAMDYLTKPCDFDTLVREITTVARAKE